MPMSDFRPQMPLLIKFGAKTENCHFKLKFGTYTNLNIQNPVVLLTFSA